MARAPPGGGIMSSWARRRISLGARTAVVAQLPRRAQDDNALPFPRDCYEPRFLVWRPIARSARVPASRTRKATQRLVLRRLRFTRSRPGLAGLPAHGGTPPNREAPGIARRCAAQYDTGSPGGQRAARDSSQRRAGGEPAIAASRAGVKQPAPTHGWTRSRNRSLPYSFW